MLYIAHRINTVEELKKTPTHYGVEVDIRDQGNRLILQHDPFKDGEDFEEYLTHYHHALIILNIKSERVELKALELLKKYNISSYFFLDSSFPMLIHLSNLGERNNAVRFSEFESIDTIKTVHKRVSWVWVDCFSQLPLTQKIAQQFTTFGLKICLVSPELQGRDFDIENYRNYLTQNNIQCDAICTKNYNVARWQEASCNITQGCSNL